MSDLVPRLQKVFRDVFDDPTLVIDASTSQVDLPDWDSVATVQLVIATELEFGIRLRTDDVASIKSVAELSAAIEAQRAA